MKIRIGYDLGFALPEPATLVLKLFVHPSRAAALLTPDTLHSDPPLAVDGFTDGFGNRCARLTVPAGTLRLWAEALVADDGRPEPAGPDDARQHPVGELPPEVLTYLDPSRYCETDLLLEPARDLFLQVPPGGERVRAICDWVHTQVAFDYGLTRVGKSARDVFAERSGVCRDLTHLAVAFCRCLQIPARYASGYLGDIGIPPQPWPMDFNAWFEAYLGGAWHVFDPRHNRPRIGRVLVARGRDAADTALTSCFGANTLTAFRVVTEEVVGAAP